MGSKICMNELCRTTTSSGWKQGWGLKSGGLATLCFSCGSAYENAVFCQSFHRDESGWRECRVCGKLIHCGCIASRFLYEHMDFGGIRCTNCSKLMEINSMQIPGNATQNGYITNRIGEMHIDNRINDENSSMERLLELSNTLGADEPGRTLHSSIRQTPERKSSAFPKTDNIRPRQGVKDDHESMSQPRLNVSMSTPLVGSSFGLPLDGGNVEGSEQNKAGSSEQGQRSRNAVQKQAVSGPEQNKGTPRAVRPPAEGRGKNQLLPRYWPRITEQELKQLAGDLNSTITPLFEKVLSASDAGRIGRLVLPKACAETYFPTINQSEGIPIKIQDIKGNEWTFQFRFWPNNNSRMYVLEGVTPCIQSLQVQAGDTVTFSKRDPGNQLIIGCRKATTIPDLRDSRTPPFQHGDSSKGASASGHADNPLPSGGRSSDESMQRSMRNPEKRKMKNIKNKRLAMPSDDALELKVTWEEAQELFRPPPNCNPTVVMIGNCEFEEFDEPPIFGKPTIFASRPSGEEEQWTQCDNCSMWRKLPPEVVLTTRWTCNENIWDSDRSSCDAPQDINQEDLDALLNKDSKRRKIADEKAPKEGEPSGLDALATAAVLGDNTGELGEPSVGPTTRHPRHRPGCTCIVCSQPPSGQGRHPQTCKCTVCLTVKRRFRTLMMRRKKKQSDAELVKQKKVKGPANPVLEIEETVGEESVHEAELFKRKKDKGPANVVLENEEVEHDLMGMVEMENASGLSGPGEPSGSQQLDLNSDPHNENNMLEVSAGTSLTNLINAANLPFSVFYESNRVGRGSRPRQHAAADESDGKEAKKKKKSG